MRKTYIFWGILFALVLSSCRLYQRSNGPQTVDDLPVGECIWLMEYDYGYVPFIIASKDYGGNVLLVRRDMLPIPHEINEYSNYYANSSVDKYLNTEYLKTLEIGETVAEDTSITITAEDSLGCSGNNVEQITRKIFLLSLTEIGADDSYNAGKEGSPLPYFQETQNHVAYCGDQPNSWWLRSPNTYYSSCTYGVGPDGTIGTGNSSDKNGIRPCFCVSSSLGIEDGNEVYSGQVVYSLTPKSVQVVDRSEPWYNIFWQ